MATIADIATLSSAGGQCAELTTLQVAAGFVTWLNVLKVFSLVLGATCFVFLFGRFASYLLLLFVIVPVAAYEVLGYGLSAALLIGAARVDPSLVTWMIVPGGLLFAGMLALSAKLRNVEGSKARFMATVTLVWGAAAVFYGNEVAGFGAVIAFMSFMGFSVAVTPLAYAIGFDDDKAVNRAGGAALFICGILVLERWLTPGVAQLDVFRTGMQWLGPFVFALSILINSSRWFMDVKKQSYVGMQVMAAAALFALMTAGSVFQIDTMLNVGTAFMILFVLEKPLEIRHRSLTSLAFTGLIMSVVVGVGVYYAQTHTEVVAQWLPVLAR
ncbi:hypothetical protein OIU34_16865 [Pararhizobium sp. BT-229]|uniref:hypothetical protein n=1 Tax=Pararhizobium sp. BT-229 TaxID=2986923 RepID=UPI0021F6FE46|nr:hypothetical protein [Pararhizobium sp. BT-229]MCV9963577.1 hypothetical protein [Pararhizobium sp. BT-229]